MLLARNYDDNVSGRVIAVVVRRDRKKLVQRAHRHCHSGTLRCFLPVQLASEEEMPPTSFPFCENLKSRRWPFRFIQFKARLLLLVLCLV
jgi:hypothetical protein